MILADLKIHHVRSIQSLHLMLNSRFTFIYGANGSGKTSLLESLYLLSCGHSFRTREVSPVISFEQANLAVFARATNNDTVSILKSRHEATQIKLNGQFCSSTSQVAYVLPCQIFYSDIFQIMDAGSSVRRSVLDWGLFHVKQHYLNVLKNYKHTLKQRNALLKTRAPYAQFIPWDKQLSVLAQEIDAYRQEYFVQWQEAFQKVLSELTDLSCSLTYFKGWGKKNSEGLLEQTLADQYHSDLQKQYTQQGPHQADILIDSYGTKAKKILSRGQQKIILFALKLAQTDLLNKHCLYLIDDLDAELDEAHQNALLQFLSKKEGQFIVTNLNSIDLKKYFNEDDYSAYVIDDGCVNTKH